MHDLTTLIKNKNTFRLETEEEVEEFLKILESMNMVWSDRKKPLHHLGMMFSKLRELKILAIQINDPEIGRITYGKDQPRALSFREFMNTKEY